MKLMVWDTETTGLYPLRGDRPFSIGWLCFDTDTGWTEHVYHNFKDEHVKTFYDRVEWADAIIAHNIKFDLKMLTASGWPELPADKLHDTLNAAALLVDHLKSKSELALALGYLG